MCVCRLFNRVCVYHYAFFSFHYCWSLPSFVRYCFLPRGLCVFLRVRINEIDFLCIVCACVSVHAEVRVCMCDCVFVLSP